MRKLGSVAALAACALAIPAAADAARPPSRTLLGLTSQFECQMEQSPVCGTVTAKLSRNGRRMKRISIGYESRCGAPNMFYSGLIIGSSFPGTGPRFAKAGQIQEELPEGRTAIGDIRIKGRLNAKRGVASGTFHIIVRIYEAGADQSAPPLDTCDPGTITWRARRAEHRG